MKILSHSINIMRHKNVVLFFNNSAIKAHCYNILLKKKNYHKIKH